LSPGAQRRLRLVLVAAQAATVVITWRLWQARDEPPNLPVLPGLPQPDLGLLVLATLALVLVRPRWGLPAHSLALAAAMALDQLRIQPELVSLALLLWATWPAGEGRPTPASGLLLGRSHLIALYLWAGVHKLLSAEYVDSASRFWTRALPGLDGGLARTLALGVAAFEVALALLVAWPPSRRWAGWVAGLMHFAIFLSLSPLGRGRNEAVWPWNLALAVAAPVLISTWTGGWRAELRASRPAAALLALLLLASPALYYAGRLDAYLSWCLYSVNVPVAVLVRAEQQRRLDAAGETRLRLPDLNSELRSLHVPFPPAQRLFLQYFARVGHPGDALHVYDPRPWAARNGLRERVVPWDSVLLEGALDHPGHGGEAGRRQR